jgi:hypothetical protein
MTRLLTDPPLVLDTDFLSSFAWVDRIDILESLYADHMVLLDEVALEIARVSHLATRVQACVQRGSIQAVSIVSDSPEALELARILDSGRYGRGESACMAYLMNNSGTMGSNNLADVKGFCIKNDKKLLCTGDCLCEALNQNIITLREGNVLWQRMIDKQRKLPTATLSDYIKSLRK